MRLPSLLLVILLTSVNAWAQAPSPSPTGADLELAKAHFHTGQIYYENARYPDAAREFEEAYRLSKKPDLLFNMGKSYDHLGDHARALAAYRRFASDVAQSPDRAEVETRIHALEGLVGRLRVFASVDGANVTLDGAAVGQTPLMNVFEVNPGAHQIEISREGYRTFRHSPVAAPGKQVTVEAQLESLVKVVRIEVEKKEKPVPLYKKWWLWTVVGVVAAGAAVTAGVVASQQPPVSGDFAQLPRVQ
jgi:tetratricopeptide (TPR) repeat protein